MKTIAFHCNQLCLRGTEVSTFYYAYYNQTILKNKSIILCCKGTVTTEQEVIDKFEKEFKVIFYDHYDNGKYQFPIYDRKRAGTTCSNLDKILEDENCNVLYTQKWGFQDGVLSKKVKTAVHCIFEINPKYKHGDIYFSISKWLSQAQSNNKYPSIPYIVVKSEETDNLRVSLNIPTDAIVFGRHGGKETFNLKFVHNTIKKIVNERNDIYFLFMFTDKFYEHPNIIYIDGSSDLSYKAKFVNTCDAMIHARNGGETFGASCAEFSIQNKPVITWNGGEKAHIDIMGEKCIKYNNDKEVYDILTTFNKEEIEKQNWDAYSENHNPEIIMQKFNNLIIK
jgi:hypothetical protein